MNFIFTRSTRKNAPKRLAQAQRCYQYSARTIALPPPFSSPISPFSAPTYSDKDTNSGSPGRTAYPKGVRRALPLLAALIVGCGHGGSSSTVAAKPAPPPPLDPWVLTTLDGSGGEPAYLSNGLIGVRVGRNGGGLGPDGKPLGFFMIDEYDPAGEEKIRPMPNPLLVTWALGNALYKEGGEMVKTGGTPLDPRGGTDYRQALDMRTGVLTTEWKQAGATIRCETALHPSARVLGQRWTLKTTQGTTYACRTLDYGGPNDPQQAVAGDAAQGVALTASPRRVVAYGWSAVGPKSNAVIADKGFRIVDGTLKAGETLTFERTLSFGLPSPKPLPLDPSQKSGMVLEKATPRPWGYDGIAAASAAAWKKRWVSDIEIDGPVEDQQAVRSFLFYLRSSIAPGARRAIAPMALSSEVYNGHVFWDADVWVFPALMLTDPDLVREISEYRLNRAGQAVENGEAWRTDRPTATHPLGPVLEPVRSLRLPPAKFPWESSVTGKETAPGPSRYEDHVTGSVSWGLSQAEALGIAGGSRAGTSASGDYGPVEALAAQTGEFYRLRSEGAPGRREIKATMSPDENHTGDNDLYTNLLAMWLTSGRKWPDKPTYKLPKDGKTFLTYDGDPLRGYKQAAAVLACYPLQYPPAEAQTKAMLERFAPLTNANGPAMTDSIEGLLWARAGDPDKGYEEWRKGWVDFTRHPLLMFSEKRKVARTYFATGAGGALQTVLYGFAGLRLDYRKATGALWSRPLADGKMLSVKPSLPKAWKRVRLKGLTLGTGRYTLDISPGKVSVVEEKR